MMRVFVLKLVCSIAIVLSPTHLAISESAHQLAQLAQVHRSGNQFRLTLGERVTTLEFIAGNMLRINHAMGGQPVADSPMLSTPIVSHTTSVTSQTVGRTLWLRSKQMSVQVNLETLGADYLNPERQLLLREGRPYDQPSNLQFDFNGGNVYGIGGYNAFDFAGDGLVRNRGGVVEAGYQGHAGAPLLFTNQFGLLVNSVGGRFRIEGRTLRFEFPSPPIPNLSKDYFVIAGDPKTVMQGVAMVTGYPTMRPKWALGFINSEWGTTQQEILDIVATYRSKKIPLDAFALDFDFKAWGEDNAGEFRWNSQNSAGNVHPDKFPDGASGKFAETLAEQGIKLLGIMKPRLILETANKQPTTQAQAVAALDCWYPHQQPYREYFSGRAARDVDFSKPKCRDWYWSQATGLFKTGIVGWWNDEADIGDGSFRFNDLQGMNMARAMYEGQRTISDERVFTLNRNFYLGAQRYAYEVWSGDIEASFASMADQRARMLASINTGATTWGMDIGGFLGKPSPELYARWIQFGAFVPIFRVHGTLNEQRQPWLFGANAEKAATEAIRLRYTLLPYWYAYERVAHETGVGVVRPLMQAFSDDPNVVNDVESWMVGDSLLVSPVVEEGQKAKRIYLPEGKWIDFFRGQTYSGGGYITYTLDAKTWSDIPLFIREGAIIPTQPALNYVDERPTTPITMNVFPSSQLTDFTYYDDDGLTYAYERGEFFEQRITAVETERETRITLDKKGGSYTEFPADYVFQIHCRSGTRVLVNGHPAAKFESLDALTRSDKVGWAVGQSVYGAVTYIKLPAGAATTIAIQGSKDKREVVAASLDPAFGNSPPNGQPVTASLCPDRGGAVLARWDDIGPDKSIKSLTDRPDFPNKPTGLTETKTLQVVVSSGKNYGAQLRAYLCPPYSGMYTFWLAGDDQSSLFLSTDARPENKRQIARVNEWTYYQEWQKYGEQVSAPLFLQAGKRYYIEVLHKADGTDDHAEVAWQGPNLTRRIITHHFLVPAR